MAAAVIIELTQGAYRAIEGLPRDRAAALNQRRALSLYLKHCAAEGPDYLNGHGKGS